MSEAPLLTGVRVADGSTDRPAAACVRILAQLGAVVVPWEDAERGDGADIWVHSGARAPTPSVPRERADTSASPDAGGRRVFASPLEGEAGRAQQVFVSITSSITSFGSEQTVGPEGHANLANSDPDHPALAMLTGAHAAAAALGALRWARRERRQAHVAVSSLDVLASCLGDTLHPVLCPRYDGGADTRAPRVVVIPCADGYVAVAAPTPLHLELLARLTGIAAVKDVETDLRTALGPWLATRTRDEVFHEAQLWQLPVVPVLTRDEVLGDEQCFARGVWSASTPPEQETAAHVAPARAPRSEPRSPFRVHLAGRSIAGSQFNDVAEAVGAPLPNPEERDEPKADRGSDGSELARPPLDGIQVLDLGMVWAGPYCGRLLAALGASVVKIEGPRHSDGTRQAGGGACAGVFADLNQGKTSLALDLAAAAGRAAFLRLARRADVVVENFSPRVMPNFGLAASVLAETNPGLISLALPAFGSTGPWASYVAYGSGLELATGLAVRDTAGRPEPAPVPYLDYLAGAYGAAAVLAALLARDGHGAGCHVEIAQREVACQVLALNESPLPLWGRVRAGGPEVPSPPPGERVRVRGTSSGKLKPGAAQDRPLTPTLSPDGGKEVATPPPNLPPQGGEGHADSASRSCPSSQPAEWPLSCPTFEARPAVPNRRAYGDLDAAALVADPRLRVSGLFAAPAEAEAPCTHFARPPWRLVELPRPPEAPAPALGANSRVVLRSVGLSDAEVDWLVETGVVLESSPVERVRE